MLPVSGRAVRSKSPRGGLWVPSGAGGLSEAPGPGEEEPPEEEPAGPPSFVNGVFLDTFSRPNEAVLAAPYELTQGTNPYAPLQLVNGKVYQSGPEWCEQVVLAPQANVRLDLDVEGHDGNSDTGLVLRHQDRTHQWALRVIGQTLFRLYEQDTSNFNRASYSPGSMPAAFTLGLSVVDNVFRGYLNGAQVLTYTKSSFAASLRVGVALGGSNPNLRVSRFQITVL